MECTKKQGHERYLCSEETCRYHILEGVPIMKKEHQENVRAGKIPACALWVADQRRQTLKEIGDILGVTRERVRQIEYNALQKLRAYTWLWKHMGVSPGDLSFKSEPERSSRRKRWA